MSLAEPLFGHRILLLEATPNRVVDTVQQIDGHQYCKGALLAEKLPGHHWGSSCIRHHNSKLPVRREHAVRRRAIQHSSVALPEVLTDFTTPALHSQPDHM